VIVNHVVAHPPFREGTGTVCYYNASALLQLGCQVRVYATQRKDIDSRQALPDFYHSMPSWFSVGLAYLTPALLSMQDADIIHLHFAFIFGSELTLLKSFAGRTPLVITCHNDLLAGGIRRPLFWLYNRLSVPLLFRSARKLVVVSRDYAYRSIYADTFRRREADLVEIPNGVDVETFRPDVPCAFIRPRYAIDPDDFLLLFVSSLDRPHISKGLDLLLDALAMIPDPKVKLLVAGEGEMRAVYEAQARRLGLGARVVFTGYLTHAPDQLPACYAAADAIVIPSRLEAFGLALAQGMSTGKPVIGSDIPGVRTLVLDGVCGLLAPVNNRAALAERISILAGSPPLRAQMGAAGRERIMQNYTWETAGERLLSMYNEVLS